jgi:hypothetical protein
MLVSSVLAIVVVKASRPVLLVGLSFVEVFAELAWLLVIVVGALQYFAMVATFEVVAGPFPCSLHPHQSPHRPLLLHHHLHHRILRRHLHQMPHP